MQTAARLDFIGLPRLRRCGGSVFLCLERENLGTQLWIVSTRFVLSETVVCFGEVGLGVRLWFVG